MTDPSRREAAEAGERHEEVEVPEERSRPGEEGEPGPAPADPDAAHEHTVAADPGDPNAGVVRARPPSTRALLGAVTAAAATLIVLVAAALAV